jgi:hypothetical protein
MTPVEIEKIEMLTELKKQKREKLSERQLTFDRNRSSPSESSSSSLCEDFDFESGAATDTDFNFSVAGCEQNTSKNQSSEE